MTMTILIGLLFNFCLATPAGAQESLWDVANQRWLSPQALADHLQPGDVLLLGEEHATDANLNHPSIQTHHGNHLRLMRWLHDRAKTVSVGMEFLDYNRQSAVDAYLDGRLSDDEFKEAAGWRAGGFPLYREKILFPRQSHGSTRALNIPRSISFQVALGGPESLTSEQRRLLPPLWERGSPTYLERFKESMRDHGQMTQEQVDHYFWAHSLWDDTMAWNVFRHRQASPQVDVLIVIVGGFHVEYGDGLASRVRRHGVSSVKTLMQVEVGAKDWNRKTLTSLSQPHPRYGNKADYLWFWQGASTQIQSRVPVSSALATEK